MMTPNSRRGNGRPREARHTKSVSANDLQPQPVIRWAGSKRKLLNELLTSVPPTFNRYYEPFAGSASLFFTLYPVKATLNDINPELVQFYACMRKHPLALYRKTSAYCRTKAQYMQLRGLDVSALDDLDRAARFFYLNRMCFNGLYRTNRAGQYNVPMGTKTGQFPTQGEFICAAQALKTVRLLNRDFDVALKDVKSGDFVYLDPPYFTPKTRIRNEYGVTCFTTDDIPRLLRVLKRVDKRGATFLLSYANDPTVLKHLTEYHIRYVSVRRCISGFIAQRIKAQEIIVTNRSPVP